MTLTEHARSTLTRQIQRLEDQLALALADPGEDPVHDFRVAIRRLSQSLRIFTPMFGDKEARRMRHLLKPAMDAAAVVRDLDVDAELLLKLELPEAHPLIARMRADRQRAAFAFTGQLCFLRSQEIPLAWLPRVALLRETLEDAPLTARAVLPPVAAGFFRAGRKTALKVSSPERLHSFRLEAKRFRYTLEVFRPFFGPVCDQRLESVRQIQSILGKRQDCEVTASILRPHASLDADVQRVLNTVEARAVGLEGDFLQYWQQQFDAPGQELLWSRYFSRRPPAPRQTT
jgi:CHAD domain-containing protein